MVSGIRKALIFSQVYMDISAKLFKQNGIDLLDIERGTDYCADLVAFFRNRMRYV